MTSKKETRQSNKKLLKTLRLPTSKTYPTSLKMTGFITAYEGNLRKVIMKKLNVFKTDSCGEVTEEQFDNWYKRRVMFDPRKTRDSWKTPTTPEILQQVSRTSRPLGTKLFLKLPLNTISTIQ